MLTGLLKNRKFTKKTVTGGLVIIVGSSLALVGWALYSSYQTGLEKLSLNKQSQTVQLPTTLRSQEILNATYSALPLVSDKVAAQKAFKGNRLTTKGDNLVVLINRSIGLPQSYAPADLVFIDKAWQVSGNARLRLEANEHLNTMLTDAKIAGFALVVNSAFRSYDEQVATFNHWVATAGYAAATTFSAQAGHSQHQLGTTADISSSSVGYVLNQDFGKIPEGLWLAANSYKYGFILSYPAGKEAVTGYSYEPWHFRYIGISAASQVHDLGWDLESYLEKYGVW